MDVDLKPKETKITGLIFRHLKGTDHWLKKHIISFNAYLLKIMHIFDLAYMSMLILLSCGERATIQIMWHRHLLSSLSKQTDLIKGENFSLQQFSIGTLGDL